MFKVRIQMQMRLQCYGGIWMRIQMLNIQMRIQMHLHLVTSLLLCTTKSNFSWYDFEQTCYTAVIIFGIMVQRVGHC